MSEMLPVLEWHGASGTPCIELASSPPTRYYARANLRTFATIAPSYFHIPTVLKRRRSRIRRRAEGEVVFCCEETSSSGITMSKDLTSPRLPSISRHFTYCHIQPTNPETRFHSQTGTPFTGVTFATSCYHIPSNARTSPSLSLGHVISPP
ncbi:hypothetical protein ARMSODRAFT_806074 [Armillaria solidipes]|uniref:Uncharacterized protein n=1 Tax=Armillaria solidipes TaxID=1076256 RepID=A0A2H3B3Q9_9AGAR|nr:hypothetical protein ARMSODRAFT_806074 [Armillaria solidipes]